MSAYHYSGRTVMIGSASTSTSGPWCINDWQTINVSWASSGSLGPSRFTIEASNADGLQVADFGGPSLTTSWSLFSGVNVIGRATGNATFTNPGARWMRIAVDPGAHSTASVLAITANGQSW